MNPNAPAFPTPSAMDANGNVTYGQPGMTQYAYVAMHFYAANVARGFTYPYESVTSVSFNQADAFFAELAKRTES